MKKCFSLFVGWCVVWLAVPSFAQETALPRSVRGEPVVQKQTFVTKQWKVPCRVFRVSAPEKLSAEEIRSRLGWGDFQASLPEGATVDWSPAPEGKGVLTVSSSSSDIGRIDAVLKLLIPRYGSTPEDFKKWAAQEFKRRQAAIAGLKKVRDSKSSKKCLEMLLKKYQAKKDAGHDAPLGNLTGYAYRGSLEGLDQKTLDALGKRFSAQIREIYAEHGRLVELSEGLNGEDEALVALLQYTEFVYVLAQDDLSGNYVEIRTDGLSMGNREQEQ